MPDRKVSIPVERTPMKRADILRHAADLIDGDRNKQYGEPQINLRLAAELKRVFWSQATRDIGEAEREAIDMCLTKLSRIGTGVYKEDNYVDLAGYAGIAGECGAPQD